MDAILNFLPGGWLAGGGAIALAVLAIIWRVFSAGRSAERGKQAERGIRAMEERLEMHREATEHERRARDLTDEQARKEAMRWSKR